MSRGRWLVALVGALVAGCNGTTGDAIYTFPAYAAGAPGAGEPFSVAGYTIQLTLAQMYVGAVYVNEAPAGSGGTFNSPVCIDPGVYCAQVATGTEVNLLDPTPQPWGNGSTPAQGNGSADLGLSWELYLGAGDINDPANYGGPDAVDLAGTATRQADGHVFTFGAIVNINQQNDGLPSQSPGQPGLNPICKRRILELGGTSLTLFPGAQLLLTVDPRAWLAQAVEAVAQSRQDFFASLPPVSSIALCQSDVDWTSVYGSAQVCIPDATNLPGNDLGSQQGASLYNGIFTGGSAAYALTYTSSL